MRCETVVSRCDMSLLQRTDPIDHSAVHGDFVTGSDHVSDVLNMKQKPLDTYLSKKGEVS